MYEWMILMNEVLKMTALRIVSCWLHPDGRRPLYTFWTVVFLNGLALCGYRTRYPLPVFLCADGQRGLLFEEESGCG